MRCEYMDKCATPSDPGVGAIYRRRYCEHDRSACARYKLGAIWPIEEIPGWLRPTMMVHAEVFLRQSQMGLTELPESMPEMVQGLSSVSL